MVFFFNVLVTRFSQLITVSKTFIVPKTGRYYLELHGGGGASAATGPSGTEFGSGGGSGQVYNEILLTSGDEISCVVGKGGTNPSIYSASDGEATSFGSYSVLGGQGAYNKIGEGRGNVGQSGTTTSGGSGGGRLPMYGAGSFSSHGNNMSGNNGAIYIEYLGE